MILFFPYNTDAPIYYRPVITIAMMVINVLIFGFTFDIPKEQIEPFLLSVGNGIHPVQWLTGNFLHADPFHLIGNMLFLWVFGLVIEGKLGAVKMLAVYTGIGIVYGAAVQLMMLGHEPGACLGASAIITGLMVMAMLWAPANSIECLLIVAYRGCFRTSYFDVKITILAGLLILKDALFLYFLRSGSLSTELLHLLGAAVGLIAGLTMLKMNFVDCEHWDIFSVWTGENLLTDEERAEREAQKPENIKKREEKRQKQKQQLTGEIVHALQQQIPLPAFVIARKTEHMFSDWQLPKDLHLMLIRQLTTGQHWTEAAASMRLYLDRHSEQSFFVRLMLIQTLMTQNKPKAALKEIDEIVFTGTEPAQQKTVRKIREKAEILYRQNLETGNYELNE
ncbi:MAG: rhomboid family intramembrane serine protease [Planctomycetaceae bacterium]|jgi:membrane associated rhomboid family serine protease|nr:rhomboid family intramembrane serine protease [Planctomycetaceae bacterium]